MRMAMNPHPSTYLILMRVVTVFYSMDKKSVYNKVLDTCTHLTGNSLIVALVRFTTRV